MYEVLDCASHYKLDNEQRSYASFHIVCNIKRFIHIHHQHEYFVTTQTVTVELLYQVKPQDERKKLMIFTRVIYMYISISFKLQSFFLFMRYTTCISDKIRNWKWSTETISHPARLYYPHVQSQCPCPQVLRHKTSTISMSMSQSTEAKIKQVHCINNNKTNI